MNRIFRRSVVTVFATFLTLLLPHAFAAGPVAPAMRLGDAVKPLAYDASLTIVPASDRFDGHIDIDIEIARPQDFFWINATRLDIKRVALSIGDQVLVAQVIPGDKDFVGLQFDAKLAPGRGRLSIDYSGGFSGNDTRGLFKQQDGGESYVFSQFESLNARRAFPCFDEPHWKTPWKLALTVPRAHVAVSNMPAASEENIGTDRKRVRFAPTPPLPSYLVALGVGPFDVVDGGVAGQNKTPLRYLTPKGRGAEARFAAKVTPALLGLLEDYFGRPYPFAKLDSLVIPVTVNFGAMENVGLITYRAGIMLARPEREDERFQQRYANIAAHEIAHQWFGNLVTMTWWNDLWLNESFATWMARKTVERFNPAWSAHEQREHERQNAMHIDRLASTRQIRQPIMVRDDLANAFDSITYDKGGAVLSMFEAWLGEAGFRAGVRRYLKRHEYANATAEDFFAALSESDPALAKGFSSFVEQPGVPRIAMALDCSARPTLRLRQERFLPGAKSSQADQQTWITPVCLRYQGQTSPQPFCTVLSDRQANVVLPDVAACPTWLLPNPSGAGYYLSTVERSMFARLKPGPLKAHEATSLMADLSTLAGSGAFPLDQMLELAAVYAADVRPEVVKAAADAVVAIHPALLDANGRIQLALWVSRHFGKRAATLGWLPRPDDADATLKLRSVLLPLVAEIGGDAVLRAQSYDLAMKWLSGKDAAQLGAMLRPILQSAAYASGDLKLLNALAAAAEKSRDSGDRNELFRALGSFSDEGLRQRGFELFSSERFDAREAVSIFWTAANRPDNAPALQQFLRGHYDVLLAKLPEDYGAIMPQWGQALCSTPDRAAFQNFFRERAANHPGGARNLAQALESIDICLAGRQVQEGEVKRFLSAQKQEPTIKQ